MFIDSHIHTTHSIDAITKFNDLIGKYSETQNILIITNHYDVDEKIEEKKFTEDFIKEFKEEKESKNLKNFYMGIEIGMSNEDAIEDEEFVCEKKFDYVLGSLHTMDFDNIDNPNLNIIENYYKSLKNIIKSNVYIDCLAHLDLPYRYTKELKKIDKKIKPLIIDVLSLLIKNDISLEINTKNDAEYTLDMHITNMETILKEYKKLNGKFVVYGSDAHCIENVGQHYELFRKYVKKYDLIPCYYNNRERVIYSL